MSEDIVKLGVRAESRMGNSEVEEELGVSRK